ncbi:MAG TPA: hypothetical protein VEW25_10025 [Allosphingosinicella sp.]|nr:hypothetical protein [Allosphingosinicella sp.]
MRIAYLMLAAAVMLPPIAVAAAEEPNGKQKERRICRREPTTGTRLQPPRVCMTQREWDTVAERAKEDLSSSQNRQTVVRYGTGGRSNCPADIPC